MCVRFFSFFYFLFLLSRCFFPHHPCRIWLPYFATIVFDGCQLYGCSLKTTARFHLLCTALASCHKVKTDILLLFMACVCFFSLFFPFRCCFFRRSAVNVWRQPFFIARLPFGSREYYRCCSLKFFVVNFSINHYVK